MFAGRPAAPLLVALFRVCLFCLMRRRDGFFIRRLRRLSQIWRPVLRCATSHAAGVFASRAGATVLSADCADCRRLWRPVLPLRDSHAAGVFGVSHDGAKEGVFIPDCADCRRLWRLSCAGMVTPPVCLVSHDGAKEGLLSADCADCRRLWRRLLFPGDPSIRLIRPIRPIT